jgi:hypothetical protein
MYRKLAHWTLFENEIDYLNLHSSTLLFRHVLCRLINFMQGQNLSVVRGSPVVGLEGVRVVLTYADKAYKFVQTRGPAAWCKTYLR